jgi:LCP family protein required for cell wall assembly
VGAFAARHKALSTLCVIAIVLLGLVAAFAWSINRSLGDIPRFDAQLERPGRPPASSAGGTNLLLVGVDEGAGTRLRDAVDAEEWRPGVFRSDAIMVVHLSADGKEAQVVSIPRDSWVPVEGYGPSKINAAFSYGGPGLLARTVEDVAGIRLDHVLAVDIEGFKDITDTLGGVGVDLDAPLRVNPGGETLGPGYARLDGDAAITYVRERKNLPRGDFDRVQRQQNLVRAMLSEASQWGTLLNPLSLEELVGDVSRHLAVDASLTNGRLRGLALDTRDLRVGNVSFLTVPHAGSATVEGQSIVRLRLEQVRALFAAIDDESYDEGDPVGGADQLPPEDQVD